MNSKYLNSDMSPLFKPGSAGDIIGKQMDFLYNEGRKIAIDYQDESVNIEILKEKETERYCNCGGLVKEQWYGNIDDSLMTCAECHKVMEE